MKCGLPDNLSVDFYGSLSVDDLSDFSVESCDDFSDELSEDLSFEELSVRLDVSPAAGPPTESCALRSSDVIVVWSTPTARAISRPWR
jgi:hypothetical protein